MAKSLFHIKIRIIAYCACSQALALYVEAQVIISRGHMSYGVSAFSFSSSSGLLLTHIYGFRTPMP